MNVTESIKSRIEDSASELGRPVIFISSTKQRKEDAAKEASDIAKARELVDELGKFTKMNKD